MGYINPPPTALGASFSRTTNAFIPAAYKPSRTYACALLLHSYGMNGLDIRTRLLLTQGHDFDDGAIFIAPDGLSDGTSTRWNHWTTGAGTDFDYLSSIVNEAKGRFNIGPVYGIGYSNGGFMIIQLSIQYPTLFHAMATFSCAAGDNDPTTPTGVPIPHVHFHGDADATVIYGGSGTASLPGTLNGHGGVGSTGYTSAINTVAKTAARNGLGGTLGSAGTAFDYITTGTGTNETTARVYSGTTNQNAVELWVGAGAAHAINLQTYRGGNPLWTWLTANHRTP